MTKQTVTNILLVVALILVIVTLAGSYAVLREVQKDPNQQAQTKAAQTSSKTVREIFVDECMGDGSSTSYTYCGCVFDDLLNTVGLEGMARIGETYTNTGSIEGEVMEAYERCSVYL